MHQILNLPEEDETETTKPALTILQPPTTSYRQLDRYTIERAM